jgi:hypothetical protein
MTVNDALRLFMAEHIRALTDRDLERLLGVLTATEGRTRFGAGIGAELRVNVPGGSVAVSWDAGLELARAEAERRKANREKPAR